MGNVHSSADLKAAIQALEQRQEAEGKMLKAQFHDAYESIKPINLIKSTFRQAVASSEVKENLINLSASLVAGYLSEALIARVANPSLKQVLRGAAMLGINQAIEKNPHFLSAVARGIGQMLKRKPSPELTKPSREEPLKMLS